MDNARQPDSRRHTGTLPPGWGYRESRLYALALGWNSIYGTLPVQYALFPNMTFFVLNDNLLTGEPLSHYLLCADNQNTDAGADSRAPGC